MLINLDRTTYQKHRQWMKRALEIATVAGEMGEVPVAAIVVDRNNREISATHNRKILDRDPTAHAEILAIRAACQSLANYYLSDCTLYVTLEPCAMCAGAIIHARLGLLVYGADDPKTGCIRTVENLPNSPVANHHLPVLAGICEVEARHQLQSWFAHRRKSL
jgi:tRNA(adenine34) deaminase